MAMASIATINVKQAVPFFHVSDMGVSLRFYREGLGFEMKRCWIPDQPGEYELNGNIRWSWLERGGAAVMLQEFMPGGKPDTALGLGTSVSYMCEDALALYREFQSRGIRARSRPFVGNGLCVVSLIDPDGYRMDFSSPADAAEESELQD